MMEVDGKEEVDEPVTLEAFEFPADCLVRQGAEARIFRTQFCGRDVYVKERFAKGYRLPQLDKQLTRSRHASEVRSMLRCRKLGIDVPVVYLADKYRSRIYMEVVPGITVKEFLYTIDLRNESDDRPIALAAKIGDILGRMHTGNVIHGDLTTSNMMLRPTSELVLLDFGLSYHSTLIEDMAVDLYVLERALLSTHVHSQRLFELILQGYSNSKHGAKVLERLVDVRARGRKRSMVG